MSQKDCIKRYRERVICGRANRIKSDATVDEIKKVLKYMLS